MLRGSKLLTQGQRKQPPDRLGARGARLLPIDPSVELGELVGLKAQQDGFARLTRPLHAFDIRTCGRHDDLISERRAKRKLPTTARP